jgi:hypothetical protein
MHTYHVQPIFEISAVMRPRVVLSATFPSGLNLLMTMTYHTERQAFRTMARLRLPNGAKDVLPATPWRPLADEQAVARAKQGLIAAFQLLAAKQGAMTVVLEFRPQASDAEILQQFIASGLFDVFTGKAATRADEKA